MMGVRSLKNIIVSFVLTHFACCCITTNHCGITTRSKIPSVVYCSYTMAGSVDLCLHYDVITHTSLIPHCFILIIHIHQIENNNYEYSVA